MSEPSASQEAADVEKIADDLVIFIRSLDEPARYISHEEMKRVVRKSLIQARAPLVEALKYYRDEYTGFEPSVSVLDRMVDLAIGEEFSETNKREEGTK